MSINEICDLIILFGGAAYALTRIFNFVAKPFNFYKTKKKKQEEAYKKHLVETLDEVMPKYFSDYEEKSSKEKLKRQEKMISEITEQLNIQWEEKFAMLKRISKEQDEAITMLKAHTVDILRAKIEQIYYDYRETKTIPRFALENLEEYYKDYVENGGNHHIGKLYRRMKDWDISEELPEYDKE